MGCDIHMVLERKHNEKWVGQTTFAGATSELSGDPTSRHYLRFAALAGVRGDGPKPKGLPEDISDTASMLAEDWSGDGHSHSWLSLSDALKVYTTVRYPQQAPQSSYEVEYPASYWFGVESGQIENYRIVFWFDN